MGNTFEIEKEGYAGKKKQTNKQTKTPVFVAYLC